MAPYLNEQSERQAPETYNIPSDRKYPLKQPPNWKPPVTRWTLTFPPEITHVHTLYIGVQSHGQNEPAKQQAESSIQTWLHSADHSPAAIDTLRVTEGFDLPSSKVWVAYWTDGSAFHSKLSTLNLVHLHSSLGPSKSSIGLWSESFSTPLDRLETNYARLDHKPGLAALPNTAQPSHTLTAYWGAGRDRLPASSHDKFAPPTELRPSSTPPPTAIPSPPPRGLGQHITGTNYANMCHIRSGQWWEKCDAVEREAYETDLQDALMGGMRYLWQHPEETGTIGIRFLQNLNADGEPIRETCGAGFHRNWADLEKWSSRHPSHLAIFNGAMKHAKRFGEGRKFMTWHEVSILKEGEARFEYVNCDQRTGVVRWVPLEVRELGE